MEAKLEEYRLKKRRETHQMEGKDSTILQGRLNTNNNWKDGLSASLFHREDRDEIESIGSEESIDVSPPQNTVITQVQYLLYFLLWATLYMIALQCEFGAVYFILSALFFIWKNTRSGPKIKGEPSAYSVFNPNCESITGTINLEQLERNMGFRA
ncbi:hypothetical protein PV327_000270 [Microctonus hyperodae]|uniref:SAYSvFN domain-containing protein n=1 Tax=Microctonus hyperodae TaxID=165561 RepID=A0AA39G6V9_MICHY|nr:hypothetical protein PV327_000270 [Microctonus hyperodae]